MKIGIFSDSFLPAVGGAEFATHHAANEMVRQGVEVAILANRQKAADLEIPVLYRVERCPVRRHRRLPHSVREFLLARHYRRWLISQRPDVVLAVGAYFAGYVAARFRRGVPCPLVIISHGVDVQVEPEIGYGYRLDPRLDAKVRYALSRSNATIAVSPSVRQDQIHAGAPAAHAYVVPNGVDIEAMERPKRQDLRDVLALPARARIILCPSRYHRKKNLEMAVRAFPSVRRSVPDAHLVFLGDHLGLLDPALAEVGKDGVLRAGPFVGQCYTDAVQSADVVVLPSVIESFGIVFLEAWAAGVPVVGTDVPGTREVVSHGRTGLLVPPGDVPALAAALVKVLLDRSLAEALVAHGRREVRGFAWEEIVRRQIDICRQAIHR